ncbi:DUF3231 family protein [Amphibacillus sediminis]|uniref:DUF3231 family protein n=1 Tax=Amphibacillus sediminis TaxID=360185 RepID=UPI000829F3F9|nr:DUF3231 family protein [Amphibacillus sediminis]
MGILNGNPQDEPLHYGEVFSAWNYVMAANGAIGKYQMLINHVGDDDLKQLLQETIEQSQAEVKQVETVLRDNGVGLPPETPEPPKADLNSIPTGARFQDPAVSAATAAEVAAGLVTCSTIIGQSIREDIAMMFGQFHTDKAALGAKYLKLNKEKGWLIPPPLHLSKVSEEVQRV